MHLVTFLAFAWCALVLTTQAMMDMEGKGKKRYNKLRCSKARFIGNWGFSFKANILDSKSIVHRYSVGWQRFAADGTVSGTTVGRFTNSTAAAVTQAINGTWSLNMEMCQLSFVVKLAGGRTATLKGYLESDGETLSMFQTDVAYKGVMRLKRLSKMPCSVKKLRGKYSFAGVSNEHSLKPVAFLGFDSYNGTENFRTYSEYNQGEAGWLFPKVEVTSSCMIYWTEYGDSTAYAGVRE